ncbi:YdcF family protein [Glacieibacterium megasporae]|uniref:YdcF family protein n=1 Tax=Glacieibacterium megasporae TaxID=2835787 RepID=UPI001C1DD8C6|nr:YdcF family protein [Polymorphobacter megasporae]UAJ08986.1 YdcF family protein [Polymorphobacter megasporae]
MTLGFFEVSKIAWALLAPETLLFLPFAVALWSLMAGHRRVPAYSLAIGFGLVLAVGIFPIGDLLLVPLESRYQANPKLGDVDAIMILGGGSNPAVAARWGTSGISEAGDRYLTGAALSRRFPKSAIYFTGGSGELVGAKISEAAVATQILEAAGVDRARVHLEGRSRSTAENAKFLRKITGLRSARHIVLVTSAFHMPRAMLTFCAAGWHDLRPYPADFRSTSFGDGIGWSFARHLQTLDTAVKEWVGLLAYQVTGRASQYC